MSVETSVKSIVEEEEIASGQFAGEIILDEFAKPAESSVEPSLEILFEASIEKSVEISIEALFETSVETSVKSIGEEEEIASGQITGESVIGELAIPAESSVELSVKTSVERSIEPSVEALSSGPKVHAPARSDEDARNFYK
jgi:hypothetical protein